MTIWGLNLEKSRSLDSFRSRFHIPNQSADNMCPFQKQQGIGKEKTIICVIFRGREKSMIVKQHSNTSHTDPSATDVNVMLSYAVRGRGK